MAENRDSADIVKEIGKLALPGMPVAEAVTNLKKLDIGAGKVSLPLMIRTRRYAAVNALTG
ncbi:hypothetical protein HED52_16085 [Ochrobactrum ciceri]|uniref:Uncharacterized protein n=1 Tax=Brucella ciceri TaxID=391287 RepID=A0ABX1DVJ8_9HYPH|nr:hypothetical protein [Brucella ciceri]